MTSPYESRFVRPEYVTITKSEILALKEAAKNSDAGISVALFSLAIPCVINALTDTSALESGEGIRALFANSVVGTVAFFVALIMAFKAWEKRGKFDEQLKEIDKMPLVQINVSQGDTSISRVTSPSPNAHAGSGD